MPELPEEFDHESTDDLRASRSLRTRNLGPAELRQLIDDLQDPECDPHDVSSEFSLRFPDSQSLIDELAHCVTHSTRPETARGEETQTRGTTVGEGGEGQDLANPRRGAFSVVNLHAQGGLGQVSVAVDDRIGRRVALKEIRPDRLSQDAQRRFLNEALITGQLEHPGIVPVYAMDEDEQKRPFYVMRFIEGQTLRDAIRQSQQESGPSIHELLPRFLDVCQAVGFAHSKGIIHRDLKPANVMLGEYGETLVVDWGLAKRIGEDSTPGTIDSDVIQENADKTLDGEVLGTPAFLAPEQARGEIKRLDARCDVFGLGGILCAMITGAPPFKGDRMDAVIEQARQGDLSAAWERLDEASCDPDLIAIAKRCLAAEPQARPVDGGAVATAIESYLAGVQARLQQAELDRVAAQTKANEETKRRRVLVGLFVAVALLVAAVGVVYWTYRQQERQFVSDVSAAWRQADERIAEAYQYVADPFQMTKTLDVGGAHLERADERIAGRTRPSPRLQDRQAELHAELNAARNDLAVLRSLDSFEIASTQVDVDASKYDNIGAVAALNAQLHDYFADEAGQSPMQLIESRPVEMKTKLLEILYLAISESALIQELDEVTWLREIVEKLDDDPWRLAAIEAMHRSDRERLAELAEQVEYDHHPAMFLTSYASWLPNDAPSLREQFLLHVRNVYPQYFWVNEGLAHLHTQRLPEFGEPIEGDNVHDLQESIRFYTAATVARPRNGGVYVNLGLALERQGSLDEAEAAYRRAILVQPDYFASYENLGLLLRNRGELAAAIDTFGMSVQLKPSAYRWARLGSLHLSYNEVDEALSCYRSGVTLEPESAIAHFELAFALQQTGQLEEAATVYEAGFRLDPNSSRELTNYGNLQGQLGNGESAIEAYRRSLDINPDDPPTMVHYGIQLATQGDPESAIELFAKSIELRPDDLSYRRNLGIACLSARDYARAERTFRGALQLDPHDIYCRARLAESLKHRGHLRESLAMFEKARTMAAGADHGFPIDDWIADTGNAMAVYADRPFTADQVDAIEPLDFVVQLALQAAHDQHWQDAARLSMRIAVDAREFVADHRTEWRSQLAAALIQASVQEGTSETRAQQLRQQAQQWLKQDLDDWAEFSDSTYKSARRRDVIHRWLADRNFAPVRSEDHLAGLNETERSAWREFWDDARETLLTSH